MRSRILLGLVAVLALAIAGCGGGGGGKPLSKADYETKVKALAKNVGAQLEKTLSGTDKNSKEAIEKGASALGDLADQIEEITPPKEVEKAQELLVTGLRQFSEDLPDLFEKLDDATDPGAAFGLLLGAPAFQSLLKAQTEYKKQGYNVDLNSDT